MVIKRDLDSNDYEELQLESDKKDFEKLKSLEERQKSNLTKSKVDYLMNFKWQSSSIYCTPKFRKCKANKEARALSMDDYIEGFQP